MRFVYDGWQCIAEMNATNNTVLRSYVWGLDLSGIQTGAGGVGGLIMMNSVQNGTHFFAYDGNGNVSALVNASNGEVTANYEYGPFGEVIKQTGLMSKINPFRFSTKRTIDSIDIILYEYRAYSPSLGRWLSRDPLNEIGGANLYLFLQNNSINDYDLFGIVAWGPVLSLAKDCVIDMMKKGLLKGFDNWYNGTRACGKLSDYVAENPLIDLCKGVEIDVDFKLNSGGNNVAKDIIGCVWNKVKAIGIKKVLEGVDDAIERKLLEQLFGHGINSVEDILVEQGNAGYKIRGYCYRNEPKVDLYFKLKLNITGEQYDLKGEDIKSYSCGPVYRGLRGHCCCE